MSFIECMEEAVKENKISKKTFEQVSSEYNVLMQSYKDTMSPSQAAAKANSEIVKARQEQHVRSRQGVMEEALRTRELIENVKLDYEDMMSAFKKMGKAERLLTPTPTYASAVMKTLEKADRRGDTIMRELFSGLHDMTNKFGDEWIEKASTISEFKKVIGKMIDGDLSDPITKSLRQAMESAKGMYRQAGGEMGDIDNYAIQMWESARMQNVTYDTWIKDLEEGLNMEKSKVDFKTRLPMTDERWTEMTKEIFDDIKSDGRSALMRESNAGRIKTNHSSDVWSARQQSRIFHFKDSESLFKVQAKYGVDDRVLFSAYVNHLRGMSRDIGMMQTLGRAPRGAYRHLEQLMETQHENWAKVKTRWTTNAFEVLTGGTDGGQTGSLYRTVMGTQHLLRSAMLGTAPVSALTDPLYAKMAASDFGLNGGKVFVDAFTAFKNKDDRQLTANSAYIVDAATGSGLSHFRINDGNSFLDSGNKLERGVQFSSKTVHRGSGLRAFTNVMGDVMSMELAGTLGAAVSKKTSWKNINPVFRQSLFDHGIRETDWGVILKAEILSPRKGTAFVTPETIVKAEGVSAVDALEVSRKMSDIDVYLRHQSTNAPTLKTRAVSTWGAQHGTFARGMSSSLMMFKSFTMGVTMNRLLPAVQKAAGGNPSELIVLGVVGTLMGGMIFQLKELIKGRDPADMSDPKFWMAAALQGGGFGPFGEIMFNEQGKFGRDFFSQILGPVAGMGNDAVDLFISHFQKSALEEDYDAMQEIMEDFSMLSRKYMPAAKLWYLRTFLEGSLFEAIDRTYMDNYDATMRDRSSDYEDRTGRGLFWKKGDMLPSRMPELSQ